MNDYPIVAPVETNATETPVVPADAAPVGRPSSARTLAIRKLLEDSNGAATYSQAKQPLLDGGFNVDESTFNVTKSAWKRAKLKPLSIASETLSIASEPVVENKPAQVNKPAQPENKPVQENKPVPEKVKPELPEVSMADAFAYVSQYGGLDKAEADLRRRTALVKQFKVFLKQAQKLAS